eukprot:GFUD01003928.1.p1 GENE.GFUD01003928.1~~GFUD01003928.1.p1  ORF type:complete len:167 (+),score=49.68 GFUD01003928.1:674-1174(+)
MDPDQALYEYANQNSQLDSNPELPGYNNTQQDPDEQLYTFIIIKNEATAPEEMMTHGGFPLHVVNVPADDIDPFSQDQTSPAELYSPPSSSSSPVEEERREIANERCRSYRKRRKQGLTDEENMLEELEFKNKHLKLQKEHLSTKVETLKAWYIKAIRTGKVVLSP